MHELAVRNQLFSYFYIRAQRSKDVRERSTKFNDMIATLSAGVALGYRYFVDSGAYTYQAQQSRELTEIAITRAQYKQGDLVGKDPYQLVQMLEARGIPPVTKLPPVDEYFADYLQFIKDYGHLFYIIAELDIEGCPDGKGGTVELDKVDRWTNELLKTRHGLKVMPVYHENRGRQWLQDWLLDTQSPYIALGSDPQQAEGAAALINLAHRCGKFIHGFGSSGIRTTLKRRPFDSIDSSTWLRSDKYGGSFLTNDILQEVDGEVFPLLLGIGNVKILTHKEKYRREAFRAFYKRWGLDINVIMQDDPWSRQQTVESLHENRKATLIAWRQIARYYEEECRWREPVLWRMAVDGKMPRVHPYVAAAREGREIKLWC